MATKYKAPLNRAYDSITGKVVEFAPPIYVPENGANPELMRQWHLKYLGDIGRVWQSFTGKGVSVGVYDQGTQRAHWDLDGNYDSSKHVVIDGNVIDGGIPTGPHGTSVAGLIAAERNGRGGVGVAYDAKVTGVNIFDPNSPIYINGGAETFDGFGSALRQGNKFDVINHSWGGAGGFGTDGSRSNPNSVSSYLADAFSYVAATGRGGLGTITVMAAGNSPTSGLDSIGVTDRHAIAVSAYRQADGVTSFYTNFGPHLLVSAPSNDYTQIGGTGIVTTDLLGADGYNWSIDPSAPNDYTDDFGGTSAATPIVSGVVALMLDANENLGWRDVQNILAASAKMPIAFETGPVLYTINTSSGGTGTARLNENRFQLGGQDAGWNGGRMHYSNDYGYGAVDAYNAVRMAEVWGLFGAAKTSANEVHKTESVAIGLTSSTARQVDLGKGEYDHHTAMIDTPATKSFTIDSDMMLERVDLTINYKNFLKVLISAQGQNFNVEGFSELVLSQIKLVAPDGTFAFASVDGAISSDAINPAQETTLGFSGFRGVESKGTWTLDFTGVDFKLPGFLVELKADNFLTIDSIKMDMYGSEVTNDDVYTYTNEFFDMLAIKGEGARKTLNDIDGGTDWINAAAVSHDIKLSLVGGHSTAFDGNKAFTLGRSSLIENAVTGDGNDTLVGNKYDNLLFGMRGNDTLNGGAGNDTLFGGTGLDKFLFDNKGTSGKDTILDWSRGDMIATQTALRGQGSDGKITVAKTAMLLLDGLLSGDTVTLSQNGGAVLQAAGQKDGYFWYSYLSGADLNPNDVIREVSFQPERTAAGSVQAMASTGALTEGATTTDMGATLAVSNDDHGAFYLYDAMAGSMSGGVLLHA